MQHTKPDTPSTEADSFPSHPGDASEDREHQLAGLGDVDALGGAHHMPVIPEDCMDPNTGTAYARGPRLVYSLIPNNKRTSPSQLNKSLYAYDLAQEKGWPSNLGLTEICSTSIDTT